MRVSGEIFFQHKAPFDRSSMTRWRQRLGEEKLTELIKESLSTAHRTGALRIKDVKRVTVDTTVQPKNVAFPTDAKLLYTSIVRPAKLRARGQAGADKGPALRPRQTVQAPPQTGEVLSRAAGPDHSRYSPQDQRKRRTRSGLRRRTHHGRASQASKEEPGRPQALFPARAGDRMHR